MDTALEWVQDNWCELYSEETKSFNQKWKCERVSEQFLSNTSA